MRIKFWGVRGSLPSPISSETITQKIIKALLGADGVDLASHQAVEEYVRNLPMHIRGTAGGNTSCVEINAQGHCLIFDAGSGLRELGLEMMKGPFGRGEGVAHFFISHTHWDHIQGFPYFVPAYIPGNRFYFYSPKKDLRDKFIAQQSSQDMHPIHLDHMASTKEFIILDNGCVEIGDVQIDSISLYHPGGSSAYRVRHEGKSVIYASDGEYQDLSPVALQPYLDFFSGADALIFDAMYTFAESVSKEGWGHSTSLIGVDLCVSTGVKRLILFHHEPTYDDARLQDIVDKTNQYYNLVRGQDPVEVMLAMEGQEIEI